LASCRRSTPAARLLDAGLGDELRLILYMLTAGQGKPLFPAAEHRHKLELRLVQPFGDGRVSLVYVTS
jgi:dihydrofolate reductase